MSSAAKQPLSKNDTETLQAFAEEGSCALPIEGEADDAHYALSRRGLLKREPIGHSVRYSITPAGYVALEAAGVES